MPRLADLRPPPANLVRKRSPECRRFVAIVGNASTWAHALEQHSLLVDALRLFCFKRTAHRLLNGPEPEPTTASLIDDPPYSWGVLRALPDIVLHANAPLSTFFRPLYRPRLSAAGRGRYTRYVIAQAPPDVCRLVLADRTRIQRRFVLLGPWTPAPGFGALANFGALPRGYDHGCRAEGGADASACMLSEHFRRSCPNATLADVRALLDDPRLIAWYIHHDAVLFRDRAAGTFVAHPKLVSLPLGAQIELDEFWAREAVGALERRTLRSKLLVVKDNGMGMRRIVTRQLEARFGPLSNESGQGRAHEVAYMQTLMGSRTIAAPPGYGSDTYRPYEALACGTVPVVLRGESMLRTRRRWLQTLGLSSGGIQPTRAPGGSAALRWH